MNRNFADHWRILDENNVLLFCKKRVVLNNKPFACGVAVLDLAKLHMFKLFFEMKTKFPSLYVVNSDTDSLCIVVKDATRGQFLDSFYDLMDYSNLPKDHPRFSRHNECRPGTIKDEAKGLQIAEVVALKVTQPMQTLQVREIIVSFVSGQDVHHQGDGRQPVGHQGQGGGGLV